MTIPNLTVRWLLALAFAALLLPPLVSRSAAAHDIPDEILVNSFIKPDSGRLVAVTRIPLSLFEGMALPKRGPGYLDLARIEGSLDRLVQAVTQSFILYENGERLGVPIAHTRFSHPSEDAFGTFEAAWSHVTGPDLPPQSNLFWNQGYFDVALVYSAASPDSRFGVDVLLGSGLSGRLKLFVQFLPPGGEPRAYQVHGGHGWLELDPSWHRAAFTFVSLGFGHILEGIDHLLFLLCLVLPFRLEHMWRLVGVVTAFTIGHSVTLLAAATGAVPEGNWFPPLIETLIALSIVYMALENIVGTWLHGQAATALRWRWLITGAFGFIHGFGFSFVLQEDLQYTGGHFLLSLLAFNVGVELGQLLFLLIVLPVLALSLKTAPAQRAGVMILSVLVAHTAWHWMLERMAALEYVQWPEVNFAVVTLLAIATLLAAYGALWLIRRRREVARIRA
ncbi:HupE/UreJ family protein (plasmid) [Skermanella mucosa]|uniref:HupE/UreJ family protein n=1 Tax=Skermanella mucosa TaxID=1789672 RepID=UPI00192C72FF|nr:HupE/UreJ family protein [Skermanella mucosa]UEM24396.1 HupE/UreJ family protein [Skermanella mucosa]